MKLFLLSVITNIFLLLVFQAPAQVPVKQWDKRFGGIDYEESSSMQQTIDGGYIVGGYSFSATSGDKTQPSQGSEDYWIVKTDSLGVKQWDKRFGGTEGDRNYALKQTNDKGYILGGFSNSNNSGDVSENSRGAADIWIVKTDSNGSKLWDKRYGGNSNEAILCLQQTNDNGYIFGGWSTSEISGEKSEPLLGAMDYWIVKTDNNGTLIWEKSFGGDSPGDESCRSIQQTSDGGYILGGMSSSGISGNKTQDSRGGNDFWIIKIDPSGDKQWDKCFGGSGDDQIYSIHETSDGGYIIGGWSNSGISGDKTQASNGGYDFWVLKTDSAGVKQWDKSFGGSANDFGLSLQKSYDGGYVFGGWSNSGISGDKTQESQGMDDFWIVKLDSTGTKKWDARFGGSSTEWLLSLQQTNDGGYVLCGSSNSNISGDKSQPPQGSYDYWLLKLSPELPSITVSDTSICSGQSITLNVSNGNTANPNWQWYSGSCGGNLVGSGNTITHSPDTTITYFVRDENNLFLQNACSFIMVHVKEKPVVKISGNLSICEGDTANLITTTMLCDLPSYLKQNLIAYYPFCGNANDLSGNSGNDGFVYGALLTTDRFGNTNSAYSFNGSGQYISGSCSNFPAGNRTVSLWFKLNDPAGNNELFGYGGNTCGQSFFGCINHGNSPFAIGTSNHCSSLSCFYQDNLHLSGWNNLIVTSGNDLTNFYLNGTLFHSCNLDYTGTFVTGKDFAFGSISSPNGFAPYSDSNVHLLNGYLDDILFYDVVLDSNQVKNLFNYFNENETPLTYQWFPGLQTTSGINVTQSGTYIVEGTDQNNCSSSDTAIVIVNPCFDPLNLHFYVEGFYLENGLMEATVDPILYPNLCDSMLVEFHEATLPFDIVHTSHSIFDVNGLGNVQYPHSMSGKSYYIAIRHRNSIETWSGYPVLLTTGMNYDFTYASSQAYDDGFGNLPMRLVDINPDRWAFYSGDINQDGGVDALDMSFSELNSNSGAFGYYPTDLNGDGASDALDMTIIENNGNLGVFSAHP